MTRRRWIADEVSGNRASLIGSHAEHLARVLRARKGQEFDIVADGVVRRGRISNVESGRVEFELGEDVPPAPASSNVSVILSVFKFDRMEWAIEKCTELGVARIIPLLAQRTERHLAAAARKRVERWRRIVREASEQSRRGSPPEVGAPLELKDALSMTGNLRIVLDESEPQYMLKDALAEHAAGTEVLLALGPEGGWTQSELGDFHAAGWTSASLGSAVLRAETAAIAALAIALAQLESGGPRENPPQHS